MSIFNDDKLTISKSFAEAIVKTASSGIEANNEKAPPALTEEMVMIPGYGMMSRDRAVIEAQTSHRHAESHMRAGNHQAASYHHKRAAMFHDALANAEGNGNTNQANPGQTATTANESINESFARGDLVKFNPEHQNNYNARLHDRPMKVVNPKSDHPDHKGHVEVSFLDDAHKNQNWTAHVHPKHLSKVEESVTEGKEPHEAHNEGKVRRALARKFKQKDKEKGERKNVEEAVTEGFKGLKHGDRVTFKTPQGQERTGTVNGLLVSHSHAVVDCGGRHGTPAVVNDKNYVSHKPARGVKEEETVTEANQDPHDSHLESKYKHAQRRKLRMKTRETDKKDRKENRYK